MKDLTEHELQNLLALSYRDQKLKAVLPQYVSCQVSDIKRDRKIVLRLEDSYVNTKCKLSGTSQEWAPCQFFKTNPVFLKAYLSTIGVVGVVICSIIAMVFFMNQDFGLSSTTLHVLSLFCLILIPMLFRGHMAAVKEYYIQVPAHISEGLEPHDLIVIETKNLWNTDLAIQAAWGYSPAAVHWDYIGELKVGRPEITKPTTNDGMEVGIDLA